MKHPSLRFLAFVGLVSAAVVALAQAPLPPPPAKYQAIVRYRILAPRDQHVLFYDRLIKELQDLQFEFQPPLDQRPETDRIDPSKNVLRGLVPSANVQRLRQASYVAGLIVYPEDLKLPEAPDDTVRLRVELAGGLPFDRQQDLAAQAALLLKELGFREALAYDHRGLGGRPYTRLQGTLPVGRLELLLKDLRTLPGGWLAPRIPLESFPSPIQQVEPIRYVEVLPDAEPIRDVAPPAPRTPPQLDKIGNDLWDLIVANEKDEAATATAMARIQLVFAGNPSGDLLRRFVQQAAPGSFVEGVLGTTVSAVVPLDQVKALAALSDVIGVRLPPAPRLDLTGLPVQVDPAALARSGVAALHARGGRGQNVRLAILDTDFRGWSDLVKAKKLPAKTRLVDLTVEHSRAFMPAPPADQDFGHGTQIASAAAAAAPDAELVLIRLASTDPYQLDEVARYLRGELTSPTLERRLDELRIESNLIGLERQRLLKERQALADDFRDETDLLLDFGFLGPVYGWIFSERDWLRQRLADQQRSERDHAQRERRYWQHLQDLQTLKGIPLVVLPYVWQDGYPLGGGSALSRMLDAETHGAVWFVPTGNSAGQSWTGLFRDGDQNGVMEFVPLTEPLPPGRWTPELNFLAWQPHGAKADASLPAKTRLRVALQWREPHDPDYYLRPGEEDFYRRPLATLRLTLLRQRDPAGKKVGADAFEVVARSTELPARLEHLPMGTVYEQTLDWTVDQPGRYAVRIEHTPSSQWVMIEDGASFRFLRLDNLAPTGIRPLGAPTLPAIEKVWELRPRFFVDALDAAARRSGRPLWGDFATTEGSIGVAADARCVIAVGAVGPDGKARLYSAAGAPPFALLAQRPTLYAEDAVITHNGGAWGTSLATGFAAGTAAAYLSAADLPALRHLIQQRQGKIFRAVP